MNQSKIISFIQFQLPMAAWCLFIFMASSIPQAKLPALEHYSDKVVHASVFAVLAWLTHVALFHQPYRFLRRHSLSITFLFVVLYGMSDEFHQYFTPGRSTDIFDVMADAFGALVYSGIQLRFRFYRDE